ncbi:beta family protein [Brevibacterium casei]|uniref:Beta protein n=2 Tax=Brevibacterium casei TaxID=33889 RepID=A0A2H1JE76_9MICO|nr:hypothetical protein B8X04_01400 [Brevibacterium casei]QPR39032.1 hypothetical protein I6G94_16085 [Brevibacterium casei]QPR43198.1 hypothetical protein I6G93_13730 [Brevibacterium casei]SMX85671.1 Beta protein [Brevibacterium casei CIP 102111]
MRAASKHYVPILKAREAEITALRNRPASLSVTPYFELQNATPGTIDPATGLSKRSKSTVTDASYFMDDIARLWDGSLYLDVSRVSNPTDGAQWWNLISSITSLSPSNSAQIIPAIAESDPSPSWRAAAPLAQAAGRAAMRVKLPHSDLPSLAGVISNAASDVGLPTSSIDVVMDWGDNLEASAISLDSLTAHTSTLISALGGLHGELISAGTPNSKGFVRDGYWHTTRREWWLWLRLIAADQDVSYGDYCLYPPSDPVRATPQYGHLRYSNGEILHVHRKPKPSTGGGISAAFSDCCTDLIGSTHYLGKGYSLADDYFDDIANGHKSTGQPGIWRQYAAIHHFALVANQLQAPPPPPPSGTP